MNRAPLQTDNVITRRSSSAVRLLRFAEVIVSSPSLGSVCMAVTSASLNGEINYHWCHLSWHRSQFDHVNQMIGPVDIPLLCNHALMKRIKRRLGYLTEFIIHNCHSVMWTINWLTRSHSYSLTLIKVIELRCYMFRQDVISEWKSEHSQDFSFKSDFSIFCLRMLLQHWHYSSILSPFTTILQYLTDRCPAKMGNPCLPHENIH